LTGALQKAVAGASPEVKAFAMPVVKQIYSDIPDNFVAKGGATQAATALKIRTGSIMKQLPGGNEFIKLLPKRTLKYTQTGEDADMYVYKGFKPNPQVIGKWCYLTSSKENPLSDKMIQGAVDRALKNIADTKAKNPSGHNAYRAKYLTLEDNGKVPDNGNPLDIGKGKRDTNRFWSGDMMIYDEGEACRMEVRTVGGKQYLLIEKGDFPEESNPEATCGLDIYVKE